MKWERGILFHCWTGRQPKGIFFFKSKRFSRFCARGIWWSNVQPNSKILIKARPNSTIQSHWKWIRSSIPNNSNAINNYELFITTNWPPQHTSSLRIIYNSILIGFPIRMVDASGGLLVMLIVYRLMTHIRIRIRINYHFLCSFNSAKCPRNGTFNFKDNFDFYFHRLTRPLEPLSKRLKSKQQSVYLRSIPTYNLTVWVTRTHIEPCYAAHMLNVSHPLFWLYLERNTTELLNIARNNNLLRFVHSTTVRMGATLGLGERNISIILTRDLDFRRKNHKKCLFNSQTT